MTQDEKDTLRRAKAMIRKVKGKESLIPNHFSNDLSKQILDALDENSRWINPLPTQPQGGKL